MGLLHSVLRGGTVAAKPIPAHAESRVRPDLETLLQLANYAGVVNLRRSARRAQHGGGYLSRFRGRGMEFDETRLYQPGDDIRSMDWRVTARTGKAHTKLYREERECPVFIAVDLRATMQFATRGVFKAVQACKLAALLAWAALRQGDRIGGQVFSDTHCLEIRPHSGRSAVLRLLEALLQPIPGDGGTSGLAGALQRLTQHARPGSRVFLISDFRGLDNGAEHALRKLVRHCEVVLLHVSDPLECQLPERGRYRLTDGQREMVLNGGDKQFLDTYQQRFLAQVQHLQLLAKTLHMGLVQCGTNDDPLQVLR